MIKKKAASRTRLLLLANSVHISTEYNSTPGSGKKTKTLLKKLVIFLKKFLFFFEKLLIFFENVLIFWR